MIETTTSETQAGCDVRWLQIRQLVQHFLRGQPICEQVEHVSNTNAKAAYTGPPATLIRIRCDALSQLNGLAHGFTMFRERGWTIS